MHATISGDANVTARGDVLGGGVESQCSGATVAGDTAVLVCALDQTQGEARLVGVTGSVSIGVGLSISVALAKSDITLGVRAAIDNATVTVPLGTVAVIARSDTSAIATGFSLAVSLSVGAAAAGGDIDAVVRGTTEARIGTDANVTGEAVTVLADTTAFAKGRASKAVPAPQSPSE